ncbi:very-long-chain (3R)-3-hydroxyacyl-CoA dehydratase 1 isoform X5 [Macaca fascicularis]|uniref:very-long-chain (3R)-3-hydroxyacyl-CoA dehydratase 1 isoform X5 n=1 Tax=Macaca fascicularis TaxID=9541 RepID=UPI003D15C5A2
MGRLTEVAALGSGARAARWAGSPPTLLLLSPTSPGCAATMASSDEDGTNGGASEAGEDREAPGKRRRLGLLATAWLTFYNIAMTAGYNFFIILYPVGVAGELLTIYAALPYVKKTGMFSIRLPNKYNVSFDYYYFLLITMASYIPLFPQLYFHMLRQRRKVLHGEVIVEKDD